MTDLRTMVLTLECSDCGAGVYPIFVGYIVESWRCPAGHEQRRTLGRDDAAAGP